MGKGLPRMKKTYINIQNLFNRIFKLCYFVFIRESPRNKNLWIVFITVKKINPSPHSKEKAQAILGIGLSYMR